MSSPMLSGRPRKFIFRIISHAYFPGLIPIYREPIDSLPLPPFVFPCRDNPAKFLYTTLEADTFSFATRQTSSSVIRETFSSSFLTVREQIGIISSKIYRYFFQDIHAEIYALSKRKCLRKTCYKTMFRMKG